MYRLHRWGTVSFPVLRRGLIPWYNRADSLTDTTENFTFPQTTYGVGNNRSNRKVLRECKRHTARRVSSTPSAVLSWEGYPIPGRGQGTLPPTLNWPGYPRMWTDWKHYLPHPPDAGGKYVNHFTNLQRMDPSRVWRVDHTGWSWRRSIAPSRAVVLKRFSRKLPWSCQRVAANWNKNLYKI